MLLSVLCRKGSVLFQFLKSPIMQILEFYVAVLLRNTRITYQSSEISE